MILLSNVYFTEEDRKQKAQRFTEKIYKLCEPLCLLLFSFMKAPTQSHSCSLPR